MGLKRKLLLGGVGLTGVAGYSYVKGIESGLSIANFNSAEIKRQKRATREHRNQLKNLNNSIERLKYEGVV